LPSGCRDHSATPSLALSLATHTYLAIDVTITPTPKFPRHDAPPNPYNPYAAQPQKVHWDSTRAKFQGQRHGTTANLNQVNIVTLIPFTIDPFGSFGYFTTQLLYGTPTIHTPSWHEPSDFTSEAAFQAFTTALTSPRAFLPRANSKYDAITPFGHTHSTHTPEQWATQILGLNFVSASAHFLLRATPSAIPAPAERARAAPKYQPPLEVNMAFFFPRRILRMDDHPHVFAS
jgi:hypothetical protein